MILQSGLQLMGSVGMLLFLLPGAQARPQQPSPPPDAPSPMEVWREETLDKALAAVRWDSSQRGPLLVINPGNTRAPLSPGSREGAYPVFGPPLGDAPPQGWTLRRLGEYFARREFPVGTLTVLAPAEMVTLNSHPPRPNPSAELSPTEAMAALLVSLTPPQIKLVTGEQGIGFGDLDQRQRDLFLALLPPKSLVQRSEVTQGPGGLFLTENTVNQTVLTDSARQQARLKLQKKLNVWVNAVGNPLSFIGLDARLPGQTTTAIVAPVNEALREQQSRIAYGVDIRQHSNNRLKPGQIAFDSPTLNAVISFAGAATIGDLIKRVSDATHVELYADRRVARLPIWVRGQTARSGDVLEALCLAVTGAFRKVGPPPGAVYLLTQDVEGMAAQRTRLRAWAAVGAEEAAKPLYKSYETFGKPDVYDATARAKDTLFPLSAATQQQVENNSGRFSRIPASELTEQALAAIRGTASRYGWAADTSNIRVTEGVKPYFTLAGIGEVSAEGLVGTWSVGSISPAGPVSAALPKITPPVKVRSNTPGGRAVLLSAGALGSGAASTRNMMEAAARHGLNQVWIALTPDDDAAAILPRAITAGKKANISVWAAPRLLTASAALTNDECDRSLVETTSASSGGSATIPPVAAPARWRRIDRPQTAAAVRAWLSRVSAAAGLGGVIVRDWAAPGYATPGPTVKIVPDRLDRWIDESERLGYTPEMRLTFLRTEGVDPIDLLSRSDSLARSVSLQFPFFPDDDYAPVVPRLKPLTDNSVSFVTDGEIETRENNGSQDTLKPVRDIYRRWDQLRADTNRRFLTTVFAAAPPAKLPVEGHALPVFLQARFEEAKYNDHWFGSWEMVGIPPVLLPENGGAKWLAQTARSLSKIVIQNYTVASDESSARRRLPHETLLGRAYRWEGYRSLLNDHFGVTAAGSPTPPTSLAEAARWDGFVLNLMDLSPEDVNAALRDLLAE